MSGFCVVAYRAKNTILEYLSQGSITPQRLAVMTSGEMASDQVVDNSLLFSILIMIYEYILIHKNVVDNPNSFIGSKCCKQDLPNNLLLTIP